MRFPLFFAAALFLTLPSREQNLPAPQHVRMPEGKFPIEKLRVYRDSTCDQQVRFALGEFVAALKTRYGIKIAKTSSAQTASLRYRVLHKGLALPGYGKENAENGEDAEDRREAYSIKITAEGVDIEAYAATGLYYALQTIRQMIRTQGRQTWLPFTEIADAPAIKYRGVMMDFAHGGLPRVDEIKRQLDFLATWKANQYYFYNEVSIRLNGSAGLNDHQSYSQDEIREIAAYARQRHIDLVPFVAFYGHLHDLLKKETYASLAIGNYGHELDPRKPAVTALLTDWIRQYAGLFNSPFIHVGFDETWETNRIARETDSTIDPQSLWLQQLRLVHDQLKQYGKTVLAWTDMSSYYPNILSASPPDVIPVVWEYAPDSAALYHYLDPVLKTGKRFFIQPGVSGWGHIYPATAYTYDNLDLCLREGLKHHTLGYITSVWTDAVEPSVRPSWSFMAYGCVCAWQGLPPDRKLFEQQLYEVLFDTAGTNVQRACADLGEATDLLGRCFGKNTSNMPGGTIIESWSNPFSPYYLDITRTHPAELKKVRLLCEEAENLLGQATPKTGQAFLESLRVTSRLIHYEATRFLWAEIICRRWDEAMLEKKQNHFVFYDIAYLCHGLIQDLMDEAGSLKDDYGRSWLSENMPYRENTILGRFDVEYGLWQKLLLKIIDYRIQHSAEVIAPQSFTELFHPDF